MTEYEIETVLEEIESLIGQRNRLIRRADGETEKSRAAATEEQREDHLRRAAHFNQWADSASDEIAKWKRHLIEGMTNRELRAIARREPLSCR